jgi:hypothetical protein
MTLAAVPLTSSRGQNPPKKKTVAVLRKQGQPETPPTAQEINESDGGRLDRANRARAFRSGRELLVKKGVPFEPNVLLAGDWPERLKDVLAQMPEMREVRRGGKKLKGAQLADTLFLPEKVEVTGDTVIVARRLIFEGRDVLIKGNHDVHIFTAEPPTLTDAAAQGVRAQILDAGFNSAAVLRRLIATLRPVAGGHITIDTSGVGRKEWLESRRGDEKAAAGGAGLKVISASFIHGSPSLAPPSPEDVSGQPGADGNSGNPGQSGTNGTNGSNGVDGVCGVNNNGTDGSAGAVTAAMVVKAAKVPTAPAFNRGQAPADTAEMPVEPVTAATAATAATGGTAATAVPST